MGQLIVGAEFPPPDIGEMLPSCINDTQVIRFVVNNLIVAMIANSAERFIPANSEIR